MLSCVPLINPFYEEIVVKSCFPKVSPNPSAVCEFYPLTCCCGHLLQGFFRRNREHSLASSLASSSTSSTNFFLSFGRENDRKSVLTLKTKIVTKKERLLYKHHQGRDTKHFSLCTTKSLRINSLKRWRKQLILLRGMTI